LYSGKLLCRKIVGKIQNGVQRLSQQCCNTPEHDKLGHGSRY